MELGKGTTGTDKGLREHDIISDQGLHAQDRVHGTSSARLPGSSMPLSLQQARWWRRMLLSLVLLNIAGLGVVGLKLLEPSNSSTDATTAFAATLKPKVDPNPEN